LQKVLSDSQIPPHLLELEFGESTACVDVELALSITEQIYNLGPRLCIDAFSTGLSSLKYLQQMPVDTLKIDCSVVQEIGVNAGGEMITDAIIALGRCMELNVVAKGVETEQQFEFLNARGCYIIQGFYYSRPLSAPDFQNLLRTDTPPFCASPSADPVRSISIAS
jgi:EAL domain-containing protein (putative c-di-GMP-specific phosphodiesterase class I)